MSKSYDNTIEIFCEKAELTTQIMSIITDNTPSDAPKDPETSTLYHIYVLFLDDAGRKELTQRFVNPGLKYSDVKRELIDIVWEYFEPFREKRASRFSNKDGVVEILKYGADKARAEASVFLARAKKNVGLNYDE